MALGEIPPYISEETANLLELADSVIATTDRNEARRATQLLLESSSRRLDKALVTSHTVKLPPPTNNNS